MKRIVLKTYGKIIAGILALIGIIITSCAKYSTPAPEYGTPSADFIIKGKVTDKSTKKPINNIAVIRKARTSPYGNDTVRTGPNGDFELKFNEFPGVDHWIYAEDLDEMQNGGLYDTDSIKVNSSQMKNIKKGSGSWFEGVFEKTDINFILEHKNVAEYGVPAATYKNMEEKK